jgi:hypothetical protein
MSCPICSNLMTDSFKAKVLNKYDALYKVCGVCGFLRADKPHWLDEAYARIIADADTGLVMRNLSLAVQIAGALYWAIGERGAGRYLDTAGGYGMVTRLMRDFGFDFYWYDEYCENKLAPGFSFQQESKPYRAVTAIEVFEHLTDPKSFVEKTLKMAGSDTLIFTTVLYHGAPPPESWGYYSFATGQHIGFFQRGTLQRLASELEMQFVSANGIHVFSKSKINGAVLRIATYRAIALGTVWRIRKNLGSRTMADHELMLKRIG